MLVLQIVTGVVLAMHYTPHSDLAFDSVEHIMRDVEWGWLMRYLHANGASMFFAVVYIHLFRGLYYGSYKAPREILWWMGVIILLLMMASSFMGYVLPWGQMSFWAATVITNMTSAIPWIGETVVTWLWGGFSVDNRRSTASTRCTTCCPSCSSAWSSCTCGRCTTASRTTRSHRYQERQGHHPLPPYYTVKDSFGLGVMMFILLIFTFYMPNVLGEVINYEKANPLQTPPHIVPEWYFLPFYAILRAIPDKLAASWRWSPRSSSSSSCPGSIPPGCGARASGRSTSGRSGSSWWIASRSAGSAPTRREGNFIWIGQVTTGYYFAHFLIIMPLIGKFERPCVARGASIRRC